MRTTSFDKGNKPSDQPAEGQDSTSPVTTHPPGKVSGDMGKLSRRIAGWSGNLLATATIVILGLTFGKQVLQWWRGDLPAIAVDAGAGLNGLADPNLPHLFAVGDLPFVFDRSLFEGSEDEASDQLQARCRELVINFDVQQHAEIPVSESQLRRLAACESVAEGDGWRIIRNKGPVITVVALRMAPVTASSDGDVASQIPASVVSWGLGLRSAQERANEPVSRGRWTLYTCSGRSQTVDSDPALALPIPPKSRRAFTLRVKGGGALIGFIGHDTSSSAAQFFDESLGYREWVRATDWIRIGNTRHACFQHPEAGTCDIQILSGTDGKTSGILTISAVARKSEK